MTCCDVPLPGQFYRWVVLPDDAQTSPKCMEAGCHRLVETSGGKSLRAPTTTTILRTLHCRPRRHSPPVTLATPASVTVLGRGQGWEQPPIPVPQQQHSSSPSRSPTHAPLLSLFAYQSRSRPIPLAYYLLLRALSIAHSFLSFSLFVFFTRGYSNRYPNRFLASRPSLPPIHFRGSCSSLSHNHQTVTVEDK